MATRHERVVAGLIYLDALYEYAYSDGKSYDNLYTAEHPWHLALPHVRIILLPNAAHFIFQLV